MLKRVSFNSPSTILENFSISIFRSTRELGYYLTSQERFKIKDTPITNKGWKWYFIFFIETGWY